MPFDQLGKSLNKAIRKFMGLPSSDEKAVNEFIRDIQRTLIQADVNVKLVLDLSKRIREKALKIEVPAGFTRKQAVLKIVYEELIHILGDEPLEFEYKSGKLNKILFVGIEGSGKTTTVAKIANLLSRKYGKVGVICTDTVRPASAEQLNQLLEGKIPVFFKEKLNAIELAKKGLEYFDKQDYNIVLVDTAGRHKNETEMIEEMKKLSKVVNPDVVYLVVDGTIGQAAYQQAKVFSENVKVGGVIVTKLDSTSKGGGALSSVVAAKARIAYISSGEKADDIEPFNPRGFVSRLLGMGDIEALIKKIELASIKPSHEEIERMLSGKFTLLDFRDQLEQMRKMGPLSKIFELIPGLGYSISEEMAHLTDQKVKKWKDIMNSMTRQELLDASIIKRSRLERIAKGAGVAPKDVKELLKQYKMVKKAMAGLKGKRNIKKLWKQMYGLRG